MRTQIDIEDEKYRGSDDTQLIIHNVCKEDEGRYQAVISRNQDVKIFSNELYLHPTGGIQSFWMFLFPKTCFVPFFYFLFVLLIFFSFEGCGFFFFFFLLVVFVGFFYVE